MRKKLASFIAVFSFVVFFNAQKHEIGLQLGASNLVGDIGSTSYIFQKANLNLSDANLPFYAGIVYRRNLNPYQTIRLDLGYINIQFDDAYATENYRRKRGLKGSNSIYSADLVFEYNFFPVNNEQKSLLSPYIFGGLSALYMDSSKPALDIRSATNVEINYKTGNTLTMGLPFGVGLKYKFNYNWAISGQFIFRPTFSDQVDYSHFEEKDVTVKSTNLDEEGTTAVVNEFLRQRNVGNPNSKDWVNSATLILSYSFGRPPCYCK